MTEPTLFLLRYLTDRALSAEQRFAAWAYDASDSIGIGTSLVDDPASELSDGLVALRARLIRQSGLFDEAFYLRQAGSTIQTGVDPVAHYLRHGWRHLLDPNPFFSVRFYLHSYADVASAGIDPLTHYIEAGSDEMRNPHALFLNRFYANHFSQDAQTGSTWLGTFIDRTDCSNSPHPIFDVDEYCGRARIGIASARDALLHYLKEGWRDGIDVSPLFKAEYYASQCRGGLEATQEPYAHYVLHGVRSGLNPHPLFDVPRYTKLTGTPEFQLDPLVHYLWKGEAAGHSPCALFDLGYYRARHHPEIARNGALWHYVTQGGRKDYPPNAFLDSALYRRTYMSPSQVGMPALEHLVTQGFAKADLRELVAMHSSRPPMGGATASSTSLSFGADPVDEDPLPPPASVKDIAGDLPHRPGRANILLVAHAAADQFFGSERSLIDMAGALGRLELNVFVTMPRDAQAYTKALKPLCAGLAVLDYRWWRAGEPPSPAVCSAFVQMIEAQGIDAVYANTIMLRECLEAARRCRVPGIVHVRELITEDGGLAELIGLRPDEIVAQVLRRSDWIVANSAATAAVFDKPGMTAVVANTTDVAALDIANPVARHEVRFGLISSNIEKKGVLDLLDLGRRCLTSVPDAAFVVIGPETSLIRAIKLGEHGEVPPNVSFAGYAANPRAAIEQINVVLSLSHFAESFGRTVLEAAAARRPAIAYEQGGLPEIVRHGETGFLVGQSDLAAVAACVRLLCNDRMAISRMGEAARQDVVVRFRPDTYVKDLRAAYERILPWALRPDIGAKPFVRPARRPGLLDGPARSRIAYFCWHFPVPSETFVLAELQVLIEQGHDVLVICRHSPHPEFSAGFPIEIVHIATPAELAGVLLSRSRTVVHAHFTYPTVTDMVWPACELAKVPFTFTAHAQDIFRYANDDVNSLREITTSPLCIKLFTLSTFHADYVAARGVPRSKIAINPNGVDMRRFAAASFGRAAPRSTRRVVAIHRYVEKKGLDLLIRAAPLVADLGVQIDLYGYGPQADGYRELAEELGATNVTVNGVLPHGRVAEVLAQADLFASPSVRAMDGDMDGIPTSVVESMAVRTPVMTTAVSGLPDLVEDEVTGLVCEPTPTDIARTIRRFYQMHPLHVAAMVDEAQARATLRHDVARVVEVLRRVWDGATIDIVVVSWNNPRELQAVIGSILAQTATPYHLIVCDNRSEDKRVGAYLESLWAQEERVTLVYNDRNEMVGPGTNKAIREGVSDCIVYVCGKEGLVLGNGWELGLLRALEDGAVGLTGTLAHSPAYLTGRQYRKAIPLFPNFRGTAFATDNPDRVFCHVQGGLFAMRRSMVDEIGGFSEAVPHAYTDVEYSLHAESHGWRLSNADGVLSLFGDSRPTLSQRLVDHVRAAHPVSQNQMKLFRAVQAKAVRHCNICDWYGRTFVEPGSECPACRSSPRDRSLFRALTESILLNRRLPALSIGLEGKIAAVWSEQFRGSRLSLDDVVAELGSHGQLPQNNSRLHVVALRLGYLEIANVDQLARELGRLITPGGVLLVQLLADDEAAWHRMQAEFDTALTERGFVLTEIINYASAVIRFDFLPIHAYCRARQSAGEHD